MSKYCYVYALRFLKENQFYVGLTTDLLVRVQQHNNGLVTSTKKRVPFELVYWNATLTRVTQFNGSTISKAHGVSGISKPDLLDVNRNRDRRVGHCAAVMRVLLSLWQEIPDARRHLASFG